MSMILQKFKVICALILLFSIIGVVLSVKEIVNTAQSEKEQIITQIEQDATLAQARVEAQVARIQQVVQKSTIAAGGGVLDLSCSDEESELSMLFANSEGIVQGCTDTSVEGYRNLNIGQKEYFSVPRDTSEPYVSGVEKIGISGAIVVSAPVFEVVTYTTSQQVVGPFQGVLFTIIDIENLYHQYFVPLVDGGSRSFILYNLNRKEKLLESDSNGLFQNLSSDQYFEALLTKDQLVTSGKNSYFVSSRDIVVGLEQWRLIVVQNVVTSLPWRQIVVGLLFVLLGGISIGGWYSLRKIYLTDEFKLLHSGSEIIRREDAQTRLLGLKDVDVVPLLEKDLTSPSETVLEEGKIYFVPLGSPESAYDLFTFSLINTNSLINTKSLTSPSLTNPTKHGLSNNDDSNGNSNHDLKEKYGMIFTSRGVEGIRELRKTYGLFETPFLGLNSETLLQSKQLKKLALEFMNTTTKAVILFDSFEQVVLHNGMPFTLSLLYDLLEEVRNKKSVIILSVETRVLGLDQVDQLEAICDNPFTTMNGKELLLTPMELEILRVVNGANLDKKVISFRDITSYFNITRPTTRVKIQRLEGLLLLQIEERGRVKSIRITSRGRSLLGGRSERRIPDKG